MRSRPTQAIRSLPRVEKALREIQAAGLAGKTLQNYADSLVCFCNWCGSRGYLDENPLKGLARFDTTPKTKRRAATSEEDRLLTTKLADAAELLGIRFLDHVIIGDDRFYSFFEEGWL